MHTRPEAPRIRKSRHRTSRFGFIQRPYAKYIKPRLTKRNIRIAAIIAVILLIVVPLATYFYYARDIGNKERLMNRNNAGIVLKDRNGTAFYSSGVLSTAEDKTLSQISDHVEEALIASEDQNFYGHHGFSFSGTARAFVDNVTSRNATGSGGSTITQQLVKNKLVGSQKNYIRKYQELAMSVAVEREYSKEEILEMYLNSAYFGNGAFGITDAAKTYFAKDPADLTLAESSLLVGLLPAPSRYSPITGDPKLGKDSQRNVLRKMVETKKITAEERETAFNTELTYSSEANKGGAEYAQHYADMIVDELSETYGEERVTRAGFTVKTTLDLNKQKFAEKTLRDHVEGTTSRGGSNAGLVSIDPRNGHVLALVGSVDYYNKEFGQVNMATAKRQPGSSFKPIYYSDAIDKQHITAATILDDKKTTYGSNYTPRNYDNQYKGKMSTRSALAESRNVPAVQVMQKETINGAAEAAKRMGISGINDPQRYGLSLALGTAEVELFQITSAYAAFANQGQRYEPKLYTEVIDKYGKTVEKDEENTFKRVLSPEAAYITSSILSDTSARAPTFGSSLNISGKNVALKTGTTNDNRDAWTIGYTPSIVTGVWLGNNANQPMRGIAGGSGAGALWKKVMTEYLRGQKRQEFVRPNGIVQLRICSGTELRAEDGNQADTRTEYFIRGTEPTGTCNTPPPVEEPEVTDPNKKPGTTNPNNNGENEEDDEQAPGTGNGDDEEEEPTTPTSPTSPTSPGSGSGGPRTPRNP